MVVFVPLVSPSKNWHIPIPLTLTLTKAPPYSTASSLTCASLGDVLEAVSQVHPHCQNPSDMGVCGEERCVTILKTAARETTRNANVLVRKENS